MTLPSNLRSKLEIAQKLATIAAIGLWRRRFMTVPALVAIGFLLFLALLPVFAPVRVYLIMFAGFGFLGFATLYLALRLFNIANVMAAHTAQAGKTVAASAAWHSHVDRKASSEVEDRLWRVVTRMQRSALENERDLQRSLHDMSLRLEELEAKLGVAQSGGDAASNPPSDDLLKSIATLQNSVDQCLLGIESAESQGRGTK